MSYIKRSKDVKIIQGKLSYNESRQAWAILWFKKEFLDEFRELKEKSMQFKYNFLLFHNYNQAEEKLKKAKEKGIEPPVFLWIKKSESP